MLLVSIVSLLGMSCGGYPGYRLRAATRQMQMVIDVPTGLVERQPRFDLAKHLDQRHIVLVLA